MFFPSILWHPTLATPAIPVKCFQNCNPKGLDQARSRSAQNLHSGRRPLGRAHARPIHFSDCVGPTTKTTPSPQAATQVLRPVTKTKPSSQATKASPSPKATKASPSPEPTKASPSPEATNASSSEDTDASSSPMPVDVSSLKPDDLSQLRLRFAGGSEALDRRIGTFRALGYLYGSADPDRGGMDCSRTIPFFCGYGNHGRPDRQVCNTFGCEKPTHFMPS